MRTLQSMTSPHGVGPGELSEPNVVSAHVTSVNCLTPQREAHNPAGAVGAIRDLV